MVWENPKLKRMETETQNPPSSSPPPTPAEPPLKKPKMSTTTTSDDDVDPSDAIPKKPRYKRRKVAIFFAYCGVGYQGMQKNPGAKTIEADLEEALYLAGAVPEPDRGLSKRWDWARTARTDKGVSAVGQVVSGRFYIDPPGFVDRLNSNLPDQIRIFGYKRVTPAFSAKKFCDRRRYVYLLPVFALDPSCHRDRESVIASFGSGSDLVKCLECSDRGRKVEGLMGKRVRLGDDDTIANGSQIVQSGISSNTEAATAPCESVAVQIEQDSECVVQSGISSNTEAATVPCESVVQSGISSNTEGAVAENEGNCNSDDKGVKRSEFSYGEKEKERFNSILKHYEGTRNFHNFTTRTKAEDPAARRYIVSFKANKTVTIEGIEFVWCEVVGQSFMLHQIRKMIGLAVAVMRGCAPESLFDTAFEQNVRINVPTAPEVGLYLDECFFTSYNNRWSDTHEEVTMEAYAEEANEFKLKYIFPHIARTEHKEGTVGLWLHSLNHRNYPDLLAPRSRTGLAADTKVVGSEVEEVIESKVDSAEVEEVTESKVDSAEIEG